MTSNWAARIVARAIPAIVGFSGVVLYSRAIAPEVYSDFAVVLNLAYLATWCTVAWIRVTMVRLVPPSSDPASVVGMAVVMQACLGVILGAFGFGTAFLFHNWTIFWITILGLTTSWSELCIDVYLANDRIGRYSIQFTVRQILVLASVIGVMLTGWSTNPLIEGFAIGNAASCLLILPYLLSNVSYRFDLGALRSFTKRGLASSTQFVLGSLTASLDKLIVIWLCGREIGGLYALVSDFVGQIINAIVQAVLLTILPDTSRALHKDGRSGAAISLSQTLLNASVVLLPATFGLVAAAPAIASTVLGPSYAVAAASLIPVLAVATLTRAIRMSYFDSLFAIFERAWVGGIAAIAATALLTLSGLITVPHWSIYGLAVVALAVNVVVTTGEAAYSRSLVSISLPPSAVAKILVATVAASTAAWMLGGQSVGLANLSLGIASAVLVYGTVLVALNYADIRTSALRKLPWIQNHPKWGSP